MPLSFKRGAVYTSILLIISSLLGVISANINSLSKNQVGQVISSGVTEIIVDNNDTSKVNLVGTWAKSSSVGPYYGSDYLNDGETGKGQKSVTFNFSSITAGDYDVYISYSASGNRATNTPVSIQTTAGVQTIKVNQQKNSGFFLLGRYPLGTNASIVIGNEGTKGYVIVDAIKIVPSFSLTQVNTNNQTDSVATPTNPVTQNTAVVSNGLAVPNGLVSSVVTTDSVNLNWNSVTDISLVGYRIYRDNVLIADLGKVNSLALTALIPGTQYSFQVSAVYGTTKEESGRSSSITVKTNNLPTSSVANPRIENGKKVYEIFEGAVIPDFGINYLSGSKSARTFASGDGSAFATYGAPGEDKQFILSYIGGVSSGGGEFDQSNIWYWDLSKLPSNLNITKAYFQFKSSFIYGAYVANGKEGVPIRTILDPQNTGPWEMPYRKFEPAGSKWYGASWRALISNPGSLYSSIKWSTLPKTSVYGVTGDLSSVLEPISAITPRISFPTSSGGLAISTDATELIKKIVSRQSPYNQYRGFYLDPTNLINPVVNASHPSKTLYVGMFNHFSMTPENRPRLVIEVDGTYTPPTLPSDTTPPAVPTGLSSSNITSTSATLTWTAVSTSDLAGYRLYRNGTKIADLGKVTSYTVTGLSAATTYSFQLSAVDTSGNESVKGTGVGVVTLNGIVVPTVPSGGYVVEKIVRKASGHVVMNANTNAPYPAKGTPIIDPNTGYITTRISDVRDADASFPIQFYPGNVPNGLMNGYARYPNVNKSGRYAIAFTTTSYGAVVYDLSNNRLLSAIRTNDPARNGSSGKIGERSGIRWDKVGGSGRDTLIYYFAGTKFYKQDALVGPSSEQVIYDFKNWNPNARYIHEESYGDFSDDMRYRALRLCLVSFCYDDPKDGTVENVIFDMVLNKPVGKITDKWPKGNDISPDGKWLHLTGYNYFYRINDVISGVTDQPVTLPPIGAPGTAELRGGHGAWAYNLNGQSVFVWISNSDDWLHSFNPESKEDIRILHGVETGYWDYHIARGPIGTRGWAMLSAYGGGNQSLWGNGNQLFMIELKPGVTGVHPNLTTVSSDKQPRIWRLGPTYNRKTTSNSIAWGNTKVFATTPTVGSVLVPKNWQVSTGNINNVYWDGPENRSAGNIGPKEVTVLEITPDGNFFKGSMSIDHGYFAEGFANFDMSGTNIYYGGNWFGNTNLELYRLSLPINWLSDLNSGAIIPPVVSPSDTTPPAVPNGLSSSNITSSSATLTWVAVSTSDLAGYRLYRNGTKIADLGKVTSYTVTGLSAATTYSFQLSAVDTSGNESVKGTGVSVGTLVGGGSSDNILPTIRIDQLFISQIESIQKALSYLLNLILPKAEAAEIPRYTATKSPVTLKGSAADNTLVARIDWQNDRGGAGQAVGTSTWVIDGLALFNGDNTITITAVDSSNNKSSTSLVLVYNPASGSLNNPPVNSNSGGGGGGSSGGSSSSLGYTSSRGGSVNSQKLLINDGKSIVSDRLTKISFGQDYLGKTIQIASRPDFSDAKTVVASNSTFTTWDVCPTNNCPLGIYPLYYKKTTDSVSQSDLTYFIYLPPAIAALLNIGQGGIATNSGIGNLAPLTRSLWYGMNGEDIRILQTVLNRQGFTISSFGAGSPGYETSYFGQATKSAVIKFQQAYGITPALGGVGPVTMAKINELLNK